MVSVNRERSWYRDEVDNSDKSEKDKKKTGTLCVVY
jgi:hypothetical protein